MGKMKALAEMVAILLIASVILPSVATYSESKQQSVAGKYISEKNPKNYLELKADGTFFLQEGPMGIAGNYEIEGDQITLKTNMGLASRGRVEGNTMIDKDSDRWSRK